MRSAPRLATAPRGGFSLAELLLAFGLLTIGILALIGLSITALKSGQKSSDSIDAAQVATRQLADVRQRAASDADFWQAEHKTVPYETGAVRVGKTDFTFECYSETLLNGETGEALGSGVDGNRVKKLDIVVTWLGEGPKSGYGRRTLRESCLVNEDT
jgi:hypothetical protein